MALPVNGTAQDADYDPGHQYLRGDSDKSVSKSDDDDEEPVKPPPRKRAKGLSTTHTAIAARNRNNWTCNKPFIEAKKQELRDSEVEIMVHKGNDQCARCQHMDYPCITIPRVLMGKNKAIRWLGCTTGKCSFSDPRPKSGSFPVTRANFSTLVGIAEDLVAKKHPLSAVQRRILLKMSEEMGIPME